MGKTATENDTLWAGKYMYKKPRRGPSAHFQIRKRLSQNFDSERRNPNPRRVLSENFVFFSNFSQLNWPGRPRTRDIKCHGKALRVISSTLT